MLVSFLKIILNASFIQITENLFGLVDDATVSNGFSTVQKTSKKG